MLFLWSDDSRSIYTTFAFFTSHSLATQLQSYEGNTNNSSAFQRQPGVTALLSFQGSSYSCCLRLDPILVQVTIYLNVYENKDPADL